jgi:hypothetical protein
MPSFCCHALLSKLFLEPLVVLVVPSPFNHIGCIPHLASLIAGIKVRGGHLVVLLIRHEGANQGREGFYR